MLIDFIESQTKLLWNFKSVAAKSDIARSAWAPWTRGASRARTTGGASRATASAATCRRRRSARGWCVPSNTRSAADLRSLRVGSSSHACGPQELSVLHHTNSSCVFDHEAAKPLSYPCTLSLSQTLHTLPPSDPADLRGCFIVSFS